MGQVLIRNLDDAVLADYREAAERNSRSLEAELRDALLRARPAGKKRREALLAEIHRIRAMTPDVPQTPGWILVREDRDGNRGA